MAAKRSCSCDDTKYREPNGWSGQILVRRWRRPICHRRIVGSHTTQGCEGQSNGCLQVIFIQFWVFLGVLGIFGRFGTFWDFFGTFGADLLSPNCGIILNLGLLRTKQWLFAGSLGPYLQNMVFFGVWFFFCLLVTFCNFSATFGQWRGPICHRQIVGSHSIQGCRGQSNGCLQVIFHKIWVSLGFLGLFWAFLGLMKRIDLPLTNCGITHNSGLSRTKQW